MATTAQQPVTEQAWRPDAAGLALALAVAAAVYFPITRNYFAYDDFGHLYHIVNWSPMQFLLNPHGGHLLFTRNAVFLLSYELFGANAAAYFWIVFGTHLATVYVLYRIVRELTDSTHVACFGAALWGSLPVQEGTLGWYSVYGHALATALTLLVLLGIVRLARRPAPLFAPLAWMLLLLAAATSFGVGIGATCAMPIVALLLLPAPRAHLPLLIGLSALALAMRPLYFALQQLYAQLYGGLAASFYLVLGLGYWPQHVRFFFGLLAYGILAVVFGPFGQMAERLGIGTGSLAVILAYCAIAIGVWVGGSGMVRRRMLASLTLAAAVYAVIAVGRGMFVTPANIERAMASPRYHYLGTAALTLLTCLVLAELGRRWPVPARGKTALLMTWAALTLFVTVGRPMQHYDRARNETAWVLREVQRAAGSVPRGRDVYIENHPFEAAGSLYADGVEFPGWAAVFAINSSSNTVAGRLIHFADAEPKTVAAAALGRRTAGLIVPLQDVQGTIYRPRERPRYVVRNDAPAAAPPADMQPHAQP